MTAWFCSGCCPLRHACAADLRRWALALLKRPGSERHQAQHVLLPVRINPTGGGIGHGGQIHAGARVHDGVNQTHEAVGLARCRASWDCGNGELSGERHGWSLVLEDWTAQDASCPLSFCTAVKIRARVREGMRPGAPQTCGSCMEHPESNIC